MTSTRLDQGSKGTDRPGEGKAHNGASEEDREVERVLPTKTRWVGVVRKVMQEKENERDECCEEVGVDVDGLVVQVWRTEAWRQERQCWGWREEGR